MRSSNNIWKRQTSYNRTMKAVKILFGMMLILSGLAAAYFFMHGGKRVFAAVTVSYGVDVIHTPTDPITVRFSEPVDTASFAGHIAVTPLVPVLYAWSDDRMTLSLKPKDRWTPGGKYRVDIAGGKAAYGKNVPVISTSFSVPGYPRIVSLNPTDGATDILLGIEDPMIVRFDRSVGDFFIDFRLSPDLPVVYENDDAKRGTQTQGDLLHSCRRICCSPVPDMSSPSMPNGGERMTAGT